MKIQSSPKPARAGAAQDKRVRKIERRLTVQLANLFPEDDVKRLVVHLRPLIHEAARDGHEDHNAVWQRWKAAPLFQHMADEIAKGLARAK